MNLKVIGRKVAIPLLTLGGIAGIYNYTSNMVHERGKISEKSMKYVKKHNLNKYVDLLEKNIDKYGYNGCKTWQQAAREVRDSLRIDSIARTNYAKGAQMVRDSIVKSKLK